MIPNPFRHYQDGTTGMLLQHGHEAIVDTDVWETIKVHRWISYRGNKHNTYCGRYQNKPAPRKLILLHRVVTSAQPDQIVDHINHNGLDNRRANLRTCTKSENGQNQRNQEGRTSKFKGVSLAQNNKGRPWRVTIKLMGKRTHVGYFQTEIQAAIAYNRAAIRLFGDFACLNQLPEK